MNQRDTEMLIGKSLRIGVVIALAITLFGGIIYLFENRGIVPDFAASATGFSGTAPYLRKLSTVLLGVWHFDGAAMVQLGVIVLIFTPVMRVLLSLIAFAIEKDKLYVLITAVVLLVILSNMIFGLH